MIGSPRLIPHQILAWVYPAVWGLFFALCSLGAACESGTSVEQEDPTPPLQPSSPSPAEQDTSPGPACAAEPLAVGLYHRVEALSCSETRSPLSPEPEGCGGGPDDECTQHADCTSGANGRCVSGELACVCAYDACFSDSDCGANEVCACAEEPPFENYTNNQCLPAGCKTDSECVTGYCMGVPSFCGLADPDDQVLIVGVECATEADACRNDEVCFCEDSSSRCMPRSSDGSWHCSRDYAVSCN